MPTIADPLAFLSGHKAGMCNEQGAIGLLVNAMRSLAFYLWVPDNYRLW